jgi:hypothetical protein
LLAAFEDPEERICTRADAIVRALGAAAAPSLAAAALDATFARRARAAYALGLLGRAASAELARVAAECDDANARAQAENALTALR